MRQNNPKLEAVIKDFMDKKIGLLIPNTYIELKKTPGIFFLVAYGAVCMPNLKYSEELQRYFEQRDIEQLSTFQFINTLLKS